MKRVRKTRMKTYEDLNLDWATNQQLPWLFFFVTCSCREHSASFPGLVPLKFQRKKSWEQSWEKSLFVPGRWIESLGFQLEKGQFSAGTFFETRQCFRMSSVRNVDDDWWVIGIYLFQFLWHDANRSISTPIFTPSALITRLLREIW